jgi:putative transposase
MDGIMLKVRHNGRYVNKCVFIVIGLRQDGYKEVLCMWLAESESASFWMSVLTDLKARGVEDILIAYTDNLKGVCEAPNRQVAEDAFHHFEEKWGPKYRHVITSWKNNWDNLTILFDYPLEIRKIIYTTNTIENLDRGIRKYTKTKVQFTDDTAVQKAVYLAIMNIEKKWSMPIQNWG